MQSVKINYCTVEEAYREGMVPKQMLGLALSSKASNAVGQVTGYQIPNTIWTTLCVNCALTFRRPWTFPQKKKKEKEKGVQISLTQPVSSKPYRHTLHQISSMGLKLNGTEASA